jgi:hypothetical protein
VGRARAIAIVAVGLVLAFTSVIATGCGEDAAASDPVPAAQTKTAVAAATHAPLTSDEMPATEGGDPASPVAAATEPEPRSEPRPTAVPAEPESSAAGPAPADDTSSPGPPTYQDVEDRSGAWTLTGPQLVTRGSFDVTSEGRLRMGFTVQMFATASDSVAPFRRGVLRLTLSAFAPERDMPGQPAGFWYVTGSWRLSDAALEGDEAAVRHAPSTLQGVLAARAAFDPGRRGPGRVAATLTIPKWLAGSEWTSGGGTLSVTRDYVGELYLQYQEVQARP